MSATHAEPADAVRLRARMVDELRADGALYSPDLIAAFLRVRRHAFAPGESLSDAYHFNRSVLSIKDSQGRVVSTVSAAHIQAVMLEQAKLQPGMSVLEIGSGGYNAALVSEMVGESGSVTTVDIDQHVTERARRCLAEAGYRQVVVQDADAERGWFDGAPFDRIMVTARSRDIPPDWVAQLRPRGRIVMPLRLRGLTRSVVLHRCEPGASELLAGGDARLCSFVPLRGDAGPDSPEPGLPGSDELAQGQAEQMVWLDGGRVEFRFDGVPAVDPDLLRAALHGPSVERFSDVRFDRPDMLELWLATTCGPTAVLTAHPSAVDDGLVGAPARLGAVALVGDGGFAYRIKRPSADGQGFDIGVRAHGPGADLLADRLLDAAQAWRDHQSSGADGGLRVRVFAADTPDRDLPDATPGTIIDRVHARFVLDWPVS